MQPFSHLDAQGQASMVDISAKPPTQRVAVAQAQVVFPEVVYQQLRSQQGLTRKGSITEVARIAGIMAAKRTAELIPLCHPLPMQQIKLSFEWQDALQTLHIEALTRVNHNTGVEMEALTAASVAALTVYDMCKALSHEIQITAVQLVGKRGGRRDVGELTAP